MIVIYHPAFRQVYAADPAAEAGRMEAIAEHLEGCFPFVEPEPATEAEILRVHDRYHLDAVRRDALLYPVAALAAGGAVAAARSAWDGEPCFGLIRPPGHHASPGDSWGFCYFNNIAVSLVSLRAEERARRAVILDFDLHFGDGTENVFGADPDILYLHPEERTAGAFLDRIARDLGKAGERDVLAVSAGFDRGKADWGDLLGEGDYRRLGEIARDYAVAHCGGRRYALLEGGYNHAVLGRHVLAFLEGFA